MKQTLLLLLLLSFGFGLAQEPPKPLYPSPEARRAEQAGNYLAPLVEFREKRETLLAAPKSTSRMGSSIPLRGMYLQTYGSFTAQVGNYREALALFDGDFGASSAPLKDAETQLNALRETKPFDATKVILELADKHRAVFINEAHHVPQHRALTIRLLRALWQKGFRYFAAETLSAEDKELQQRGYPVVGKTGYYSNEPVYGDLIRTALQLGYKLVPYEFEGEPSEESHEKLNRQQRRDKGQAQNLYERVFKSDPNAKIVVHAGYAHVYEKEQTWWSPMAKYFRAFTGLDPLTIDQTEMTEHSEPKFENAVYKGALEQWKLTQPAIFRAIAGEPYVGGNMKGLVDLQVFSPRSEYRDGRPTWLQLGGTRRPQRISVNDLKPGFPYLVQAVLANEGADAVPVDQIEVPAPTPTTTLYLPQGNFIIRIKDRSGTIIRSSPRKVN